jgi:hypothetical protein
VNLRALFLIVAIPLLRKITCRGILLRGRDKQQTALRDIDRLP